MTEVVASCFLKVRKVDGIVHMRKGIKITEANLHRIPARKIIAHGVIAVSFLRRVLLALYSNRIGFLKTIHSSMAFLHNPGFLKEPCLFRTALSLIWLPGQWWK